MKAHRTKRSSRRLFKVFARVAVAAFVWFGFWSVPVNADLPSQKKMVDVREMSVEERANLGEKLIFGRVGESKIQGAIGKAQCPLCHGFNEGLLSERAPNLFGITIRAWERLQDPRYHLGKPNERDTVQKEAFPGSGTATTAIEYIAESAVCPDCYVVVGGGVRGTDDRESAEPALHKPPIGLSIDELIAVNTWLYVHDGNEPPPPQQIEKAYRKFIPLSEWPAPSSDPDVYPARSGYSTATGYVDLTGQEAIHEIFTRPLCFACHNIPGISGAVGTVGPNLVMKTTGPMRLKDRAYKGKATTVREYVIESIVNPSIYVVPAYPDNVMPKDYGKKLNKAVIDRMADYLSQLEEGKEPPEAK